MVIQTRKCPYCGGSGCEECDTTGRKYSAYWTTEDGHSVRMTGSGYGPDEEGRAAMEEFVRAAAARSARV